MVDVGLTGRGDEKLDQIKQTGIEVKDIKRIILTHTHFDHIGCIKEVLASLPDAQVWVHQVEGDYLERGDERIIHGNDMFAGFIRAQYGVKDGFYQLSVHRKLDEGDILEIGSSRWEVLHIPGHSAGGIGLYDAGSKVIISGDTVYADYNIGRFDLFSADGNQLSHIPGHSAGGIGLYDAGSKVIISGDTVYADYNIGRFDLFSADGNQLRTSLERLAQLEAEVLLPGHNRILTEGARDSIRGTLDQWRSFLG
jgi:glyoxylase-like metal-dependent hydrolase (beta-lactamase superfamily II)